MNACWIGCGFSGVPSPSSVVISAPATVFTGVTHDRIAWPLAMTVQAPHCAETAAELRSAQREVVAEHVEQGRRRIDVDVLDRPLTFKVNFMR